MGMFLNNKIKGALLRNTLLCAAMVFCGVTTASAAGLGGSAHFINIAAFYKLDHGFTYPKEIKGDEAALFSQLDHKAHYIFMSNSSGVMNDDVINIQNDLLRGKADASYEDYGVNCSFSVMMDAGKDTIDLTGTCNAFLVEHDGSQLKEQSVIPPTRLPDIEKGQNERWKLIYEDKHGVGIYGNAESQ